MQIQIIIRLKGAVREDEVAGGFVSYCPALKIYAHGDTSEKAAEALQKTLRLYVETCLKRGTLNDVLEKAGFVPLPNSALPAIAVADIEAEYIAIQALKFDRVFEMDVPMPYVPKTAVLEPQTACAQ